jgi:phosphoglucomutase
MTISPLAGKPAPASLLVDVPRLITAYYENHPDPSIPAQRVSFGTSGHRGSAFDCAFNEWHILAITQAICEYRRGKKISGPLFIGADTHALSAPALASALEVLAANNTEVAISKGGEFTPTPVISHAIISFNAQSKSKLSDGIVITPSHNPPEDGGFKYNPPSGGPADMDITQWIQQRANELLEQNLNGVRRTAYEKALHFYTVHEYDYVTAYVNDIAAVINLEAVRASGLRMGVDPLGGAGVHYWPRIAEKYDLNLTVVNDAVDPTFRFMYLDWDGRIRMDPSSTYAMQGLIGMKDKFDIAFACDTDHDRHGIVTKSFGLLPPNHYLSVCIEYLFTNRPEWSAECGIGKTIVSSSMIDRVARDRSRKVYEVPVGFKWFVDGLVNGSLGFVGEESAGATLLRRNGKVWTTDKDGIAAALLSAEMTARAGKDPGQVYADLSSKFGECFYERIDAAATAPQRKILASLTKDQIKTTTLAGQPIKDVLTSAPGNNKPIGGVKVISENGWFALRPSGTEEAYKIYAESFKGADHLRQIQTDAQKIATDAMSGAFEKST